MALNHKIKPTIIHLIASLESGGAERQLQLVLPRLTNFNHIVVCLRNWGEIGDELRQRGFSVYFINTPHLFSVKSILKFKKIIQNARPSLIITYLPFADIFGRFWGRYYGVPKIVCFLRSTMKEWRYFPLILLNILSQKLVDHYFVVSNSTKNIYEKWGLRRGITDVIYNGVEIRQTTPGEISIPELASHDAPIVGYVARLRKERGHVLLFFAIALLKKKNIDVRLVLAGDGPYRSQLEKEARNLGIDDRVIFLGHRSDVFPLFASFTIYAHPSLYEGMSNALLESMAAGCPIVASDILENRELIKNNYNGILVSPNNPEEFSKAIMYLINNHEKASRYGDNARKRAKGFDINHTVSCLNERINKIINDK